MNTEAKHVDVCRGASADLGSTPSVSIMSGFSINQSVMTYRNSGCVQYSGMYSIQNVYGMQYMMRLQGVIWVVKVFNQVI